MAMIRVGCPERLSRRAGELPAAASTCGKRLRSPSSAAAPGGGSRLALASTARSRCWGLWQPSREVTSASKPAYELREVRRDWVIAVPGAVLPPGPTRQAIHPRLAGRACLEEQCRLRAAGCAQRETPKGLAHSPALFAREQAGRITALRPPWGLR